MSVRKTDLRNARQAWRLYHAATKAAAWRRAQSDKFFAILHPGGHEESLRWIAEEYPQWGDIQEKGEYAHLKDIHPDAFGLLAKYGIDYKPQTFEEKTYHADIQPVPFQCFRNAALVLISFNENEHNPERPVVYVEGIVSGVHASPMLHGWNSRLDGTTAFDWTFYATSQWARYLGIPFTKEEYDYLIRSAFPGDTMASFFHRKKFQKFKPFLLEILEKREPFTQKPAPS